MSQSSAADAPAVLASIVSVGHPDPVTRSRVLRCRRSDGSEFLVTLTEATAGELFGTITVGPFPPGGREDDSGVFEPHPVAEVLSRQIRDSGPDTLLGLLLVDLERPAAGFGGQDRQLGDGDVTAIAATVRTALPEGSRLVRVLMSRMAVVLPDVSGEDDVQAWADRIVATAAETRDRTRAGQGEVGALVHIGGVVTRAHQGSARLLLHRAGQALHRTWQPGMPHIVIGEHSETEAGHRRENLQQALSRAATDDSLGVHLQPVVDLRSHEILGFESLARWTWGGRLLTAGQFIPLAEETGAVFDIDAVVLRRACRLAARMRRESGRPLRVSVNVSALHLASTAEPATLVADALDEAGLPGSALVVELPEAGGIADLSAAAASVSAIRSLGCSVALTHFGAGTATLRNLTELPSTAVKVDRSITAKLPDPAAAAVISGVVRTASLMGLHVVAEGIETTDHADRIAGLGVRYGQGVLYGAPMPPDQAFARANKASWHALPGAQNRPGPGRTR